MIALDGPSALVLYRDRDAQLREAAEKSKWRGAPLRGSLCDRTGAADACDSNLDDDGCAQNDDSLLDDLYHLSDEDIAAELDATTDVNGCAIQCDWADAQDEQLSEDCAAQSGLTQLSAAADDALDQPRQVAKLEYTRRYDLSRCASRSADLKQIPLAELGIETPAEVGSPLYLLVGIHERRRKVRQVNERALSNAIGPGWFKLLGGQVLVPVPEFCFLLLAAHVSVANLVQIGMELCGHYRMVGALSNSLTWSRRTIYNCDALTTPERIRDFLDSAKGFPGIARARRAAKYLVSGSASPMETILYLLLCLPRSLGGYGMPAPVLNVKRRVNKKAGQFTFARTLIPDLYWSKARLDVEYDSEEFHAEEDALNRGARRTMAMRAMKVDVFSMTGDMVRDSNAFDGFAHLLARRLHKRIRRPDKKVLRRRGELRAALLDSPR